MTERWIEIPEYPRYLVSSHGRIINRLTDRLMTTTTTNRLGYCMVRLSNGFESRKLFVHRLVASAFFDADIIDYEVNHLDGDKTNNCIWNLELCSRSENMRHAYAMGLVRMPKETRVLCVETGEEFRTLREAARSIGVSDHKAILRVLDKPHYRTRGYTFVSV